MDKLLKKIYGSFSVSGREEERKLILEEILSELKVEHYQDKMGNLIAKLGSGTEKIMISAPLDAVGLLAIHIEKDGTVKTANIGNFNSSNFAFTTVKSKNGLKGKYIVNKKDEGYLDFGFSSETEAIKKVREGDIFSFFSETTEANGKFVGTNLTSTMGSYVLIKLIEELAEKNIQIDKEIYFVFSVQHELGGRGARAAAYEINPDYAIIIQAQATEDNLKLGAGPILSLMDGGLIVHHEIKETILKIALDNNIKIQYSISKETSDGAGVHKENGGIKTGVLSFPVRYMKSPAEMIDIEDIAEINKLLYKFF